MLSQVSEERMEVKPTKSKFYWYSISWQVLENGRRDCSFSARQLVAIWVISILNGDDDDQNNDDDCNDLKSKLTQNYASVHQDIVISSILLGQ